MWQVLELLPAAAAAGGPRAVPAANTARGRPAVLTVTQGLARQARAVTVTGTGMTGTVVNGKRLRGLSCMAHPDWKTLASHEPAAHLLHLWGGAAATLLVTGLALTSLSGGHLPTLLALFRPCRTVRRANEIFLSKRVRNKEMLVSGAF